MTQVEYDDVDLETVLWQSELVVVVRAAEPRLTKKQIPIHEDHETYPPFSYVIRHLVVEERLRGALADVGETIDVLSPETDNELESHRAYYLQGMGESPIYESYAPSVPVGKRDKRWIAFVRSREDGRFEDAVIGAAEGLGALDEVRAALRRSEAL
jgi:hypothetical protein